MCTPILIILQNSLQTLTCAATERQGTACVLPFHLHSSWREGLKCISKNQGENIFVHFTGTYMPNLPTTNQKKTPTKNYL